MKIKQFQQMMSMVAMLILVAFMTTSCNKSDEDTNVSAAVAKVVGTYRATITPTMGTQAMAMGTHLVKCEAIDGGKKLHFFFDNFNAPMVDENGKVSKDKFMPFVVSVDVVMNVKDNKDGSLSLLSEKGTFKAKPKDGKPIDMSKLPEGILPPNLNGFETDKLQAEGTFKDGKLQLNLLPNILPVKIVIEGVRE